MYVLKQWDGKKAITVPGPDGEIAGKTAEDVLELADQLGIEKAFEKPDVEPELLGQKVYSFRQYFEDLSGTKAPVGIDNPHAHHIVMQKGPNGSEAFVKASKAILRGVGINLVSVEIGLSILRVLCVHPSWSASPAW